MTDEKTLDESAADALPQDNGGSDTDAADEPTLDETAGGDRREPRSDKPAADDLREQRSSELPASAPAPVSAPVPERYLYLDRIYRTGGIQPIPRGTYKLSDAGLQGRGPYLLQNRIAFEVDGPEYAPASPADDDAFRPNADAEVVAIEYVGANKSAHRVKARGIEFEVPRQIKGADGKIAPRVILVRADLAPEFLSRGTFQKGK